MQTVWCAPMSSRLHLLTLLLLGCPERRAVASVRPDAGGSQRAAQPEAVAAISAAKLDAWLRYHRALSVTGGEDAGLDAKGRALRERAVRAEAGLTELDIDRLEDVIGAVVTHRTIGKLTGAEALRGFDKVTLTLKPEQRQKVEAAFGDVKARAQQGASLEAERAKFGDEAVTLVLAREAELTEVWDSLLNGRGER
jgi:hypothetical protein